MKGGGREREGEREEGREGGREERREGSAEQQGGREKEVLTKIYCGSFNVTSP